MSSNIIKDNEKKYLKDIPSTLSKKFTTFGYGKKHIISMAEERKVFPSLCFLK